MTFFTFSFILKSKHLFIIITFLDSTHKYILDFYCEELKLHIELDGGQHYSDEGKKSDDKRDQYLQSQNIIVLRFSDRDVLTNIEGVVKVIEMKVEELRNH